MIKTRSIRMFVAASAVFAACIGNAAANSIQIGATTPFAKNAPIREVIKNECQLETKLPAFVKEFADSYGIAVDLTEKSPSKKSKGKVLILTITGVQGGSGGAWSGGKSVQVKGELYNNGKQIGDFMASRYSGGGFFGAYKGTCSIMGRCVKTIGKDIGIWLQNPTRGAHLGDF